MGLIKHINAQHIQGWLALRSGLDIVIKKEILISARSATLEIQLRPVYIVVQAVASQKKKKRRKILI
jgi:hypothetical protein